MASFLNSQICSIHRDLRAEERVINRERKQKQKYCAYRGVKPSWVGQKYYDLVVVKEEVIQFTKSRKTRKFYPSVVVEHELSDDLDRVVATPLPFSSWYAAAYIAQAIAEKRIAEHIPKYISYTPQHTDIDTLEAPLTLSRLPQQCAVSPANLHNSRLKLKLRVWTKRDNFEQKDFFIGGPDRRHHRGKRRVREKHLQKWNEHDLQRDNRSHATLAHDIDEENFSMLNWASTIRSDPKGSLSDTVFWDPGFEGHNILLFGEEEPGTDELVRARLAGEVDECPAYRIRGAVLERQHSASSITEEDSSSLVAELWDEFAWSLNSSEIIFVNRDDTDSLVDVDKLSDLADAFEDWDMVSEPPSPI